ncbi:MAG: hypothetical protein HUJ16_13650 [Kangiella sp.]|nr:hypothetical protein [Kangiella sp.]
MDTHKNIVRLPVENKWVDESLADESSWRRLLKTIAGWFQRSSKKVEPVDELLQLREKNKAKRAVLRCATILLNQQEESSTVEPKEGNVIDFRTMGKAVIKDD